MTLMHATLVAALLFAVPALAQTQPQDHQQHHPGTPAPQAQAPTPPSAQPQPDPGGMMGGGMMGQRMMGQGGMGQGTMGQGMMSQGGTGQGMMGHGMMGQGGGMMQGRGMASAGKIDRVEGRLAFLKTELKITDAQLPLWSAFADAIRTNATTMKAETQAMHGRVGADVSLPDRVLAQANAFAAHAEEMLKFKAALDPLYAVFTPEQKKTADEIVFSSMGVPVGMM